MKAKMWRKHWWIKVFPEQYLQFYQHIETLLTNSGFTVLEDVDHYFDPQGYSKVWLLAESHLAMHSFPEENKFYVELTSCNKTMYKDFCYGFKKIRKFIERSGTILKGKYYA